jgi:hypothetical protein
VSKVWSLGFQSILDSLVGVVGLATVYQKLEWLRYEILEGAKYQCDE